MSNVMMAMVNIFIPLLVSYFSQIITLLRSKAIKGLFEMKLKELTPSIYV